jgi:hypothetical protein
LLDLLDEFCGGLAVAIHARPRATLDSDLLLPREPLDRARDVAQRLGYRIEAEHMVVREDVVEIRLSKPDPDTGDLLSLDLLLVTPALTQTWEARERARPRRHPRAGRRR